MRDIEAVLKDNGWEIQCEHPFEIRHEDGSYASGQAAHIVLHCLKTPEIKYLAQIAKLLDMAGDQFGNHGCNDLPSDFWDGVSHEDQVELYRKYHEWNGDLEDFNPDQIGYLGDWVWMGYFSEVLKGEA